MFDLTFNLNSRLLPRSTATLTFPQSSQVCGVTFKTPTREKSSNRRVQPTLKSRKRTLTRPTRGNKTFWIVCNYCPVFTQCNCACKDGDLQKVLQPTRINCANESDTIPPEETFTCCCSKTLGHGEAQCFIGCMYWMFILSHSQTDGTFMPRWKGHMCNLCFCLSCK